LPIEPSPPPSEAVTQFPQNKFVRARKLLLAGDILAARALSDEILAGHPDHAGALIQRSRLESAEDNYRKAREYTLAAYRAGTTEKLGFLLLLKRLRIFNLIAEFRDVASHIPAEVATDPEVAVLVARLFGSINQPKLAFEFATRAAAENPASADLQASIGLSLLNLGRFDEAESHLRECLRIDPAHAPALWQLSRLPKGRSPEHNVDHLRRAMTRAETPRATALIAFALHRELDALADYPGAAEALTLACSSMRKTVRYDAKEDERLFSALKALPMDAGSSPGFEEAPFTPIFIVGMHRSGTTLLEQMLSGHDDIRSGGELYDFTSQLRFAADHHCSTELDLPIVESSGHFDYAAIGKGYADAVEWRRQGKRFVTDKLPSNFLNIGFILRALPNAKILHMSRDPMETCFSNLREPFSDSTCRYSYDQDELAGYYRHYFSLMQHWRRRFPGRIHDVTYTALATDPAAELRRVASYLAIEYQPSMLETDSQSRSVNTASAVQVRQKPSLPLRPKWQEYRELLTPLEWRLSNVGQRF
jgi:tetratricopeptide (TPR) repeat protein